MKSRFRRKLDRKIRNAVINVLLRHPLSFLTRSSFRRTYSLIYIKNQKTVSEELIFDRSRLQVTFTEYNRFTKEHLIIQKWERNEVARQYQNFVSLILSCNFFDAHSDTLYSYQGDVAPDPEKTVHYEFWVYWRWNDKLIYFIELTDNTYEGISEGNREKFGVLEEYLKHLEQEEERKTKSNPH